MTIARHHCAALWPTQYLHCNVTGRAGLRAMPGGALRAASRDVAGGSSYPLVREGSMTTKMLFALPFAIATLAGCAATSDTSPSSQSSLQCADLSGSAYLECQQNVTPAANEKNKSFKMVRPKAPTGDFGGMGS